MGQTHTALRTGAKSKSVLLSEQLIQINSYQTEGLLVDIVFFLYGTCCIGQALQPAQLLPQTWMEQLGFPAAQGGREPGAPRESRAAGAP